MSREARSLVALMGVVTMVGCVAGLRHAAPASAAEPREIELWPDGVPEPRVATEPAEEVVKKADGFTRRSNVSKPRLVVYDVAREPGSGLRAAVIVVPGGGFTKLADDHEGAAVCRWLNSQGFISFLVLHRTPTAELPQPNAGPVQDVQKAVQEVRKRAAAFRLDPAKIALLGFSAGGQAALVAATNPPAFPAADAAVATRPDALVLLYPWQIAGDGPAGLRPDVVIDVTCPPTFIAQCGDDTISVPQGATALYRALVGAKVPAEIHLYERGGHGFGLKAGNTLPGTTDWKPRAIDWLRLHGWDPNPAPPRADVAAEQQAATYAVEKTATGGAIVRCNDVVVAEYVVDRASKPFLWRVIGPTGKPMTRSFPMETVAGETADHVHQRGLTFGHQSVAGFDTWHEDATYRDKPKFAARLAALGAIRHRGYRTLAGGTTAVVHAHNEIVDARNQPVLAEERRMTFSHRPGARVIDLDIDLIAAFGPVELADRKDAGVYLRVPDSMAVDRGLGGTIVNSAGQRDAAAWAQKAEWVDYHGPVAGERLGVAILNHPTSFRHPTPWHVRGYGLFCANPFGLREMNPDAASGAVTLAAGERLSLRHRFIFHEGDERAADIAAAYAAYAAESIVPLSR